jgi:hypothetical protein
VLEAWPSVWQCLEMVRPLRDGTLWEVARLLEELPLEGINVVLMGPPTSSYENRSSYERASPCSLASSLTM